MFQPPSPFLIFESQWSRRSTCLQVQLPWSMVAMKLWWPPALLSGPGPQLRCPGSPTFLGSQKCSYSMKSMARPAHKCATSGSPHVTSRVTHWPVWSATRLCRVTSGSPTSSMCSVRLSLGIFNTSVKRPLAEKVFKSVRLTRINFQA